MSTESINESVEEEAVEPEAEEELSPAQALAEKAAPVLATARHSSFFHVVSQLERLSFDAVRVGGEGPPRKEAIRFRHDYNLNFSTGDISQIAVKEKPQPPDRYFEKPEPYFEVVTTFLGVTGTVSPLPLYMAEEVVHEDHDNPVRRDFLDVFHHRLISLFYRCVSKFSPAREHLTRRSDAWMNRALFLTGLDPEVQTRGVSIPPSTLVRLGPLLAGRGRGPRVLELAMTEVLNLELGDQIRVRIEEFEGNWVEVDNNQRMSLGVHNHALGSEAILGKRAYDQSGRFAIRIGPLHGDGYRRLLRDGDLIPVIKDVVTLCSRESLDFDLKLELAEDAVPAFNLSSKPALSSELGRNTRLRGQERSAETMTVPDVLNL